MNMFEFTVFGIYLTMLTLTIVAIQYFNPGKAVREELTIEYTEEKMSESELEEPDSSEGENPPFNPETECYTMTENPILRHRLVEPVSSDQQSPALELVD